MFRHIADIIAADTRKPVIDGYPIAVIDTLDSHRGRGSDQVQDRQIVADEVDARAYHTLNSIPITVSSVWAGST